jgi:hypothetical protein
VARQLNLPKDRLARSRKIANIDVEVRQKLRELGMADNQALLLKIASAGDAAQQMEALEQHQSKTTAGSKAPQQRMRTPSSSSAKNEISNGSGHPKDSLAPPQLSGNDGNLSDAKDGEGSSSEPDATNDKVTKVLIRMKGSDWDEIEQHRAGTRYNLTAICVRQKSCSLTITKIERLTEDADAPM